MSFSAYRGRRALLSRTSRVELPSVASGWQSYVIIIFVWSVPNTHRVRLCLSVFYKITTRTYSLYPGSR